MKTPVVCLNLGLLVWAASSNATLDTGQARGEKTVQFAVAGRAPEICVIPRRWPDGVYSARDGKREEALCSLDFYQNAAVCPKLNSTNPGLDVHELPEGLTPAQVEDHRCSIKDPQDPRHERAKKVAKYKLSTSCSYTPSILSYYEMSRMLGNVLNVPPAVLRTLDRKTHLDLGNRALKEVPRGALIQQTWQGLVSQLAAGPSASRRDLLFTDAGDQSYGALVDNPAGEVFYAAFFNGGANNLARTANLRDHNPLIALLARPGPVSASVGREFTAANVQKLVQLRDAANMIVMDTLLNQQDRMGNIHAVERYYYQDPGASAEAAVQSAGIQELSDADVARLKAVKVSEMILKDNDCGVSKQNIDRQVGLDAKIGHLDPQTYDRLLRLDAAMNEAATRQYFRDELLYTATDYSRVRANVAQLAGKLKQACNNGHLQLDLDLHAHFSGRSLQPAACEPR